MVSSDRSPAEQQVEPAQTTCWASEVEAAIRLHAMSLGTMAIHTGANATFRTWVCAGFGNAVPIGPCWQLVHRTMAEHARGSCTHRLKFVAVKAGCSSAEVELVRTGSGAAYDGPAPPLPRRPWLIMCMRPRAPDAALDAACDSRRKRLCFMIYNH